MASTTSKLTSKATALLDQQHDQMKKFGLDKSQIQRFSGILRTMNINAIPTFASKIRQFGHHTSGPSCDSNMVACKTIGLPLCGSFHIVFTLEFNDGVKWMLKVSANGYRFDSVAAAALTSEARTMQLLKRETTIPVPAVYAFDGSSSNDLNTPFILMERIEGKPLYEGWFDDEMPKACLEHFRVRALQSLAEAMTQLNKFTLDRGGALEFDSAGRPVGLRGAKVVDAVAMYNWGTSSDSNSVADQIYANSHDPHDGRDDDYDNNEVPGTYDTKEKTRDNHSRDRNDHDDDEDIFCEKGPFDCPKSAFLFDLDRSEAYGERSVYSNGCYKVLRMFIELAFAKHGEGRFVLTHPDLDIQNVLVAEDGTLRGLIDWDGVAFVPRESGCAQYPLWLMRDWVPYYYLYDIRQGKTEEDAGYEESSPTELASYRALYAHFIEKEIERHTGGPDRATTFGTLPKQEAQLTRRSLIMRDLDLAAGSPFLTTDILSHIVYQIEKVTEPDWGDMETDMDSISSTTSSKDAAENHSDTNGDINGDVYEEDPETGATKNDDDLSSSFATTASINEADKEAATLDRTLSQVTPKVTGSSSEVPQPELGSQDSSKACLAEAEEMMPLPNADLKVDVSTKSTTLGWGRKLLCFGCNAAEKGLRRLTEIGHVLEATIEDMAEVLAEVEAQQHNNTQHAVGGESGPAKGSLSNQQMGEIEHSKATEKERPEDIPSTKLTVVPEQLQDMSSVDATVDLQGALPYQHPTGPNQLNGVSSNQPTMTLADVPARKAALIEAEKARQKAQYREDKGKTKEELKVWEGIAFMVRNSGISLDQLQMNQGEIARLVFDTLKEEKRQEYHLMVDPIHPPTATATEQRAIQSKEESGSSTASLTTPQPQVSAFPNQNSRSPKQHRVRKGKNKNVPAKQNKMSPGFGTEDFSLSELSTDTTISDIPIPGNQPETSSNAEKLAGGLVLGRKVTLLDGEAIEIPAKVILTSSSRPPFTQEDPVRPKKASSTIENICSFGTSCLRKIFSSPTKCGDDKGSLTSNSSANGGDDGDSDRSDTSESCKSSVTSLSDVEVDYSMNSKPKEDGVSVSAVIPAAGNQDGEIDRNGATDAWKQNEGKKIMACNNPAVVGGWDMKDGSEKTYDSRSGEWVEMKELAKSADIGEMAGAHVGIEELADSNPTDDCEDGLGATSEENAKYGEADGDQIDPSTDEGGEEEDVKTFRDDGEFRSRNIFMLLGMDMLDELRLLRLQEGFLKLLEQY